MFDCRGVVPFAVYIDRVMPTIIAEIFEKMWSIIKILILHNMHVIEYKNIWNLEQMHVLFMSQRYKIISDKSYGFLKYFKKPYDNLVDAI